MARVLRKRRGPIVNGNTAAVPNIKCSVSRAPRALPGLGRHPYQISSLPSPNPPSSYGGDSVYRARVTEVLMNRYCVQAGLGYGGYGTVVQAEDQSTGSVVAVKLLHKDDDANEDIHLERRTYRRLVEGCDVAVNLFAQVIGSGSHDGFHCIVFELCHGSLYDIMKGLSGLAPLPGRHVLEMAYQMLSAIAYLHSLGIIHTDLKPDNIAVKYSDTTVVQWLDPLTGYHDKKILVTAQICILDLGNVVDAIVPTGNSGRVGTSQYRAPEVTLGCPWSFGVDAFSLGCVIAEIHLSDTLVPSASTTDQERLATVEKLVGPFPEDYAQSIEDRFPDTFAFEDTMAVVIYPPTDESISEPDHIAALRRLEQIRPISTRVHNGLLYDLIRELTRPNPAERLKMEDAVKHRYFDALDVMQLG